MTILYGYYKIVIINDGLVGNVIMPISRYLAPALELLAFPRHKMAFISGPRQCGKTTLAKAFLKARGVGAYFNWDEKGFRTAWSKRPLAAVEPAVEQAGVVPIIVLDEIHKAKSWKRDLKGVYDSLTEPADILVTASAKLNVYRRGGDSLLGRYHHFRLHPFSLGELLENKHTKSSDGLIDALCHSTVSLSKKQKEHFENLWEFGPFPEPLVERNKQLLTVWQMERVQRLVREDLRDLSRIQELSQVEMLVSLLPARAAGVLSITALREDLEVAFATMKLWIDYLKHVYYLFEIKPYAQSIPRSLKKEGKLYLYDWSEVTTDGARFENLVACHLLKYAHFLTDTGDALVELRYLKNKQRQEIDFLLLKNGKPWLPVEVKLSDDKLSPNWKVFLKHLPCDRGIQVVKAPGIRKIVSVGDHEVLVISAEYFLPLLC